jgi:sensor histidine kinase YesM
LDSQIDSDFSGIPPALMQPYIENAILHGIQHRKDNEGLIQINFTLKNENVILCEVIDNGLGRDFTAHLKKTLGTSHNSRGMLITKERLQLLNKSIEGQLNVEVEDLKDSEGNALGTKIKIYINIQEL